MNKVILYLNTISLSDLNLKLNVEAEIKIRDSLKFLKRVFLLRMGRPV